MSDDFPASAVKPRRIRLPSPGVLLAGTLMLSVIAGARWYSVRYDRQQSLIQYVESLGGNVKTVDAEPLWAHEFLVEQFGEAQARGFGDVVSIDLMLTHITDDELQKLRGIAGLQHLNLCFTQISDLQQLSGLSELKSLDLRITRVDDGGLQHLGSLTELRELWLNDTLVSDEAVNELRNQLPDCQIHNEPPPFSIPY